MSMKIRFEKYESGGNDFVLIDDRKNIYNLTTNTIKKYATEILELDLMV